MIDDNRPDPRPALLAYYEKLRTQPGLGNADVLWALILSAQKAGEGHEDAEQLGLDILIEQEGMSPEAAGRHLETAVRQAKLECVDGRLIWVSTGRTIPESWRRHKLATTAFDAALARGEDAGAAFRAAAKFDNPQSRRHHRISSAISSHLGLGRSEEWRKEEYWEALGYQLARRSYYGLVDCQTNTFAIKETHRPIRNGWTGAVRDAFGYDQIGFEEGGLFTACVEIYRLEEDAEVLNAPWEKNVPPFGIGPDGQAATWLKWIWQSVAVRAGYAMHRPRYLKPYAELPANSRAMVDAREWPLRPHVRVYCTAAG